MPKLNQVIAIEGGIKGKAHTELTKHHHLLQKEGLLEGLSRSYRPKDEDGERLPSESKRVQVRTTSTIGDVVAVLTEFFDVTATKDWGNTVAKADIKVEGWEGEGTGTILEGVPVPYLLFLEKQLTDVQTFVKKLPTLDANEKWEFDETQDCFRSETTETVRTKKVPKSFVKYEATKEHPAQVEMFTEDVVVGHWEITKFSGAIRAAEQRLILERVEKILKAVKLAREEANSVQVDWKEVAAKLFNYIF